MKRRRISATLKAFYRAPNAVVGNNVRAGMSVLVGTKDPYREKEIAGLAGRITTVFP